MIEQGLKTVFRKAVGAIENFELTDPLLEQLERKLFELGNGKENGKIKGVLWDLDDHFLDTTRFIHGYLTSFVQEISIKSGREHEEIRAMMRKYSNAAFGIYHVNPVRWRYVTDCLAKELGGEAGLFDDAHDELMILYENSPDLFPGALTVLELVKQLGLFVVWVTNANEAWTVIKFGKHNLWEYSDQVILVDENRPKGVSDWWAGVALSRLPPAMLLGGGDSIEADLKPLVQIGVRGVIGVPPLFELAKNGHSPDEAVLIDGIDQWPDGVLRLR